MALWLISMALELKSAEKPVVVTLEHMCVSTPAHFWMDRSLSLFDPQVVTVSTITNSSMIASMSSYCILPQKIAWKYATRLVLSANVSPSSWSILATATYLATSENARRPQGEIWRTLERTCLLQCQNKKHCVNSPPLCRAVHTLSCELASSPVSVTIGIWRYLTVKCAGCFL